MLDLTIAQFIDAFKITDDGSDLQKAVEYILTSDYHGEKSEKISTEWQVCDAVKAEMDYDSVYVADSRGIQAISDEIFNGLTNAQISYGDSVVNVAIAADGQSVTVKT
jgi:polyamine oxidase